MPPAISATLQEVLELDQANKLSEALAKLDSIEDQIPDEPNIQKIVGLLYQHLSEDEKSLRFLISTAVSLPELPINCIAPLLDCDSNMDGPNF